MMDFIVMHCDYGSALVLTILYTHTGHYTGKQLTPEALTTLHVILWDKASEHFEV